MSARLVARRTLSAASLVAKRWREPAQAALWRTLYISDGEVAEQMMASPVWGKFRTTGVEVWVNGFDDADELDRILRRLEGLREVRIGGQWDEVLRIGAGWMSHPFLAGES